MLSAVGSPSFTVKNTFICEASGSCNSPLLAARGRADSAPALLDLCEVSTEGGMSDEADSCTSTSFNCTDADDVVLSGDDEPCSFATSEVVSEEAAEGLNEIQKAVADLYSLQSSMENLYTFPENSMMRAMGIEVVQSQIAQLQGKIQMLKRRSLEVDSSMMESQCAHAMFCGTVDYSMYSCMSAFAPAPYAESNFDATAGWFFR